MLNKMNFIKKTLIFLLLLAGFSIFNLHTSQAYFRVNQEIRETRFVEGIRHTYLMGEIDYNGTTSRQNINYIGANPTQYSNLNIVTGDHYQAHGWGMGNINLIIDNIHDRYSNYEVLGGVNADFYNTTTGEPISPVIRNFELIYPGGTSRTLVGFKDNGEVVFGKPCYGGYVLKVFDEDGALKMTLPVSGINRLPQNNDQITVYFSNHAGVIDTTYNKAVMNAIETKIDGSQTRYFAKGTLDQMSGMELTVDPHQFVIVGHEFNNDQLITAHDYAIVQQSIGCGFEDVRFAVGGWEHLVDNGVPNTNFPQGAGPYLRHPRTAVGIKQNGEVFFVVVDGRNFADGFIGVTAPEMAEIMVHFGAYNAINLDGGGSSTIVLQNEEKDGYDVLNTPSDGRLRSISNAVFFVKGEHIPVPDPVPFPDTREQLQTPRAYVDLDGHLRFNHISNSSLYKVFIDDKVIETTEDIFPLNLEPGVHSIRVRAYGDPSVFKPSEYSTEILYVAYTDDISRFIELFRGFTRKETE